MLEVGVLPSRIRMVRSDGWESERERGRPRCYFLLYEESLLCIPLCLRLLNRMRVDCWKSEVLEEMRWNRIIWDLIMPLNVCLG